MSLLRWLLVFWVFGMGFAFTSSAEAPATVKLKPEVEAFIAQLVANHNFDEAALRRMFAQLKANDAVVRAIQAPATSKPWHEFRDLFVSPNRISGGAAFWSENAEQLERARSIYGVPEEVIVSIIGVETIYGKRNGSFRIVDALYTLG
jgi:membrane-bound lytic murein transglycosylase B